MPTLATHSLCNGCSACMTVCPRAAIKMSADDEGFPYPAVDASTCVKCGSCEQACPVLNPPEARLPLAVYAAINKDEEVRRQSSSGGVFSLIGRQVLDAGGVVYGAGWSHDLEVVHKRVTTLDGLAELRGSKYVQSDLQHVYADVRADLCSGRRVLFSGTPCQIAGLGACLETATPALLCVDFICHAVASPKVFSAYKAEIEQRVGSKAVRIEFRRKDRGWRRFSLSVAAENGKEYLAIRHSDPFLRAFLSDLINRPSCHACACRELRSGSDITLADCWNVQRIAPELDDDRGTSLVLVNTADGEDVWNRLRPDVTSKRVSYDDTVRRNWAVHRSPVSHPKRAVFFGDLGHGGARRLMRRCLARPPTRRIHDWLRSIKRILVREHRGRP